MIHLICYDIGDDRRRTKLADLLLAEGYERIQYSVFLGRRHPRWKAGLWPRLEALVAPGTPQGDRLVVLGFPQRSLDRVRTIGSFDVDMEWLRGNRHTLLIVGRE